MNKLSHFQLEAIIHWMSCQLIVNSCVPVPGVGDHDTVVLAEVDCMPKRQKPAKRKIHMWGKVNLVHLRNHVHEEVIRFMDTYTVTTPIQDLWNGFTTMVESAVSTFVPSKFSSTRFSQAWITRHCRHIIGRKKRAYRKARKTKNQLDWARFKKLKSLCQRECRSAYQD